MNYDVFRQRERDELKAQAARAKAKRQKAIYGPASSSLTDLITKKFRRSEIKVLGLSAIAVVAVIFTATQFVGGAETAQNGNTRIVRAVRHNIPQQARVPNTTGSAKAVKNLSTGLRPSAGLNGNGLAGTGLRGGM